jgi:hypothetical protein
MNNYFIKGVTMLHSKAFLCFFTLNLISLPALAGEDLLGYVKGAETLPAKGIELYQIFTLRNNKGVGSYNAYDIKTELEYGVTNRLSSSVALMAQKINRSGLVVDGYLPEQKNNSLNISGVEAEFKYNILSPAMDDFGLTTNFSLDHNWKDNHSGLAKKTTSFGVDLLLQKFFLEGELVWLGSIGTESTYADRGELIGPPADFEWSTSPEVELELKFGTGISYRFISNWYLGAEVLYETEFETEIGQERWSYFAGPSIHYGSSKWWATLTWLPQISGGGESYEGQDENYHLIEKTKQELKVKFGFNF